MPRSPRHTFSSIVRPAGLWPSVPKLETGLLNAERVNRKSKVYSRVEQFTRPTECPTQPRRMIDANRVYTFILQRNAYKTGSNLEAIIRAKNRIRADWLPWAPRTVRRNEARHNDGAILISKARYCSLLTRCWNGRKIHGSAWPILTAYNKIVGASICIWISIGM